MKILSPLDNSDETERLIKSGADELYCGFVPEKWKEKYTLTCSINRRQVPETQFKTFEDLKKAVEIAHSYKIPVFLTLNKSYYSQDQYPLVLKEVDNAIKIGIDALLVTDTGLVLTLQKENKNIDFFISTLAATFNSEAAKFYRDLGAKRIVLPRSMRIQEIKNVISHVKGIDFEVFILGWRCCNVDGLCTFIHFGDPKTNYACRLDYDVSCVSSDFLQPFKKRRVQLHQNIWHKISIEQTCGVCALYDLEKIGVHGVKIIARGAPTEEKIKYVKFVRNSLDLLKKGTFKRGRFRENCKELYRNCYGVFCNDNLCYHPYLV